MRPLTRTLGIIALVATELLMFAAQKSPQVEWLYYGGDQAGTKYSPLTDINARNVDRLQIAWQWKHWETTFKDYNTTPGFFESTPLMIDGVLYVTTPYNSVAAVDAESGKELWRFDGEAYTLGQLLSSSGWKLRGTAFWRDNGRLYIFLNRRHRLFALDARTGEPVHTFGNNGEVSLTDLPRISDPSHATQSSPPWAELTAIDLNRGLIAWKVPLGEGSRDIRESPLLKGVALPNRLGSSSSTSSKGGAMVTKGGLVFIGGGDGYLYAFDKKNGKETWRGKIPYENTAVPMTYRTPSGRQFIVVATGAGADNALVAFALGK